MEICVLVCSSAPALTLFTTLGCSWRQNICRILNYLADVVKSSSQRNSTNIIFLGGYSVILLVTFAYIFFLRL